MRLNWIFTCILFVNINFAIQLELVYLGLNEFLVWNKNVDLLWDEKIKDFQLKLI